MPSKYLSKIKVQTAKNIAKNFLATKTGKKISDRKFKELIKKDKDLNKFAYSSKNSSLAKFKAKKFFNQVIKKARSSENLKINQTAIRKMGLRFNKKKELSEIGLNKIYQKAANQEISAMENKGPSPEEIRKQKRHEKALKTLHKYERAREISEENKKQNNSNPSSQGDKSSSSSNSNQAPPPIAGGVSAKQPSQSSNNTQLAGPGFSQPASQSQPEKNKNSYDVISLLPGPVVNKSPNIPLIENMANKLEIYIKHLFPQIPAFKLPAPEEIKIAFGELKIPGLSSLKEYETINLLAKKIKANLFSYGTVKKDGPFIDIKIKLINPINNKEIIIAQLHEKSTDIFEIQKKISWQIKNALTGQSASPTASQINNLPDVEEMPI